MRNLFFLLSISILFGCSRTPDSSLGEQTLKEIVTNQSNGVIQLEKFNNLNGLEKEIEGVKMYIMEFSAQIEFKSGTWKAWEPLVSWVFADFQTYTKPPRIEGYYQLEKKHFGKGSIVEINGEIYFEKAEKGWRKTDIKIKKSNVISNPDPDGITEFWDNFKSAVMNKNRQEVRLMTLLPMDFFTKTEQDFYQSYDTFFDEGVLKVFNEKKPQQITDSSEEFLRDFKSGYFIEANYCYFIFKQINGQWLFAGRSCPG